MSAAQTLLAAFLLFCGVPAAFAIAGEIWREPNPLSLALAICGEVLGIALLTYAIVLLDSVVV